MGLRTFGSTAIPPRERGTPAPRRRAPAPASCSPHASASSNPSVDSTHTELYNVTNSRSSEWWGQSLVSFLWSIPGSRGLQGPRKRECLGRGSRAQNPAKGVSYSKLGLAAWSVLLTLH